MFVEKPDRFSSCMITGRTDDPTGFVTEHKVIDGFNGPIAVYFSIAGLRQLAQRHEQIGLVPVERAEGAEEENARLMAELEEARERVAELEATQERIAGLAREGFRVQKVMGRPKKDAE